jgi:hypothetical protein
MKLDDAIVRVKRTSKVLQRLEGAIRDRLEPARAKGRQVPIVFTQSFVFTPTVVVSPTTGRPTRVSLPMQLVQQPIVNGAEDCYLKEASYTAIIGQVEGVDFPNTLSPTLNDSSTVTPFTGNERCFDFQWNAQMMSTQSNYLSQANNAQFLSRRSLGHTSRGVRRQLYSNMLFKAGDALLVSVQPTYWGLPIADSGAGVGEAHPSVQLTISFFGTRGPDMVELAEDADLET